MDKQGSKVKKDGRKYAIRAASSIVYTKKKLCISYFVGKNFKVNDLLTHSESWLSIFPTAEVELQTENIYQTFSIELCPLIKKQAAVAAQFPAKFKPRLAWLSPRAQSADLLVILLGFAGLENCSYSFFHISSYLRT